MKANKEVEPDLIPGIAFDLSKTRTGVSLWENDRPKKVLHLEFGHTHGLGHLLFDWRHELAKLIPMVGMGWVAYEDVKPVNKRHAEIHFAMAGVIEEMCFRREIPIIHPTATQVKKALTGSGKSKKEDMLQAAREKYPRLNIKNDDEADAIAVGLHAINIIEFEAPPTTPVERTPF